MKTLRIDFVSDVACPWCAVGLGALDIAAQRLQGEVALALHFQPFELNPQMPPEGEDVDEHLQRKYGRTKEEFAAARAALRERGAAVGFAFGERTRIWNTFDAHRLLHWAGEMPGLAPSETAAQGAAGLGGPAFTAQHALKAALLQAYHGEGRNPSDPEVLLDAVARAGLDGERARQILQGDEYADAVRAAEAHWQGLGIQSVPAVVIYGRHLISGGQPPEVFEQALRQIAATQAEG